MKSLRSELSSASPSLARLDMDSKKSSVLFPGAVTRDFKELIFLTNLHESFLSLFNECKGAAY